MRKLILITVFLTLCTTRAYADPNITGVAGTVTHNQSITITGTAFGTKSPAAPHAYDDFESCSNGSNVVGRSSVIGAKTWTEYSTFGSPVCTNSSSFGQGSIAAYKASDGNDWINAGIIGLNSTTAYCSYRGRWSASTTSWESAVYKPSRMAATGNMYSANPTFYPQYQIGVPWPYDGYQPGGVTNPQKWPMPHLQQNTWFRNEMYTELSNPGGASNGNAWSRWDYVIGVNIVNGVTRGSTFGNAVMDSCSLPFWIANNNNNNYQFWGDDFYLDNTQARVEICNSSTWAARSNCQIQIPSAWSTTSATVTVKQGSFASGANAYLYLIDSDGLVNSSGQAVTFGQGSGGDTTPPLVNLTDPLPNDINRPLNYTVTAVFTEAINCGLFNTSWITISPDTKLLASCDTDTLTMTTTGQSYNTQYTFTISTDVEDLAGNNLASPYVSSYTTLQETPADPDSAQATLGLGSPVDIGIENLDSWTIHSGTWVIESEGVNSLYAVGLLTNEVDLGGVEQWILVEVERQTSTAISGAYFRFTGNTADTAYAIVMENASSDVIWKSCTDTSCTDIQTVNRNFNNGDFLGVRVTGTGTSTQVEIWDHGGTDPGDDLSTWGTALFTLTNDPASEANTGQYVGVINEDVSGRTTFDNFSAGLNDSSGNPAIDENFRRDTMRIIVE